MSDTNQSPVDLDTLTDEEVMALDPSQIDTVQKPETEIEIKTENIKENVDDETDNEIDDETNNEKENTTKDVVDGNTASEDIKENEIENEEEDSSSGTIPEDEQESNKDLKLEENTKENKDKINKEVKDNTPSKEIINFYDKITAPFKADGKEIKIRNAEDAIRMMQMGANYSRRMQEMKPLRALNTMLSENGLDNPDKLNELIDISKGNVLAIKKLLKDNNIDILDLDLDELKDKKYNPNDYRIDPKDLAFKEAIDNTLTQEGGDILLQDINTSWDDESKSALREEPGIFQNLLAQMSSGVYDKIKDELNYQRNLGYLLNIPFLQAYHQVGAAMQKVGVFNNPTEKLNQSQVNTPVDTGVRKASQKTEQPNSNFSTVKPPKVTPSRTNEGNNISEKDYSSMSDDDFLKLGPPS